jgi:hypothetical protein
MKAVGGEVKGQKTNTFIVLGFYAFPSSACCALFLLLTLPSSLGSCKLIIRA